MNRNLSTWLISVLLIIGGFTAVTGVSFPIETVVLGIMAIIGGVALLLGY